MQYLLERKAMDVWNQDSTEWGDRTESTEEVEIKYAKYWEKLGFEVFVRQVKCDKHYWRGSSFSIGETCFPEGRIRHLQTTTIDVSVR